MEEERQRRRLALTFWAPSKQNGFPVNKWNLQESDIPNSVGFLPSGKRLHSCWKSPLLVGKSTINGPFSIAMLVITRGYIKWHQKYGKTGQPLRLSCCRPGLSIKQLIVQTQDSIQGIRTPSKGSWWSNRDGSRHLRPRGFRIHVYQASNHTKWGPLDS